MKECKNAQNKNQNQKPRNIVSTNVVVVVVVNADAAVTGSVVSAVLKGITYPFYVRVGTW